MIKSQYAPSVPTKSAGKLVHGDLSASRVKIKCRFSIDSFFAFNSSSL